MTTSLNSLAFELLEFYRGQLTDDVNLDSRLVKQLIHEQRALWLRNELNKNRTIDPNFIQDLGCVELETVDANTCLSCQVVSTGCNIKRSKLQIPNTIERHNDTTFTRIAPINLLKSSFSVVPYQRAVFSGNGRFNFNHIFVFIHNGYIWLKSNQDNIEFWALKYINIQGVFEKPDEIRNFTNCSGVQCYNDDMKYPINLWMWNYIKGEIFKQLNIKQVVPTDTINDGSENPQPAK
jgi:hypothetical protein